MSAPADLEPLTDPELVEPLRAMPRLSLDAATLPRIRELMDLAAEPMPDGLEVSDRHATSADGHQVLVRLYRPPGLPESAPALFWIHGGGLIVGSVTRDNAGCAAFANALGAVVASVEYRLAPEHRYPAAIDDCHAAWTLVVDQAAELGIDPDRIVVGGVSAGGGLAAALAQRLHYRGEAKPCFQFLRYPMLDDRNDTESARSVTDDRTWNHSTNDFGWNAYLDGRAGADDIDAAAAPARADDLSGLPPTVITVGTLDPFLDENIAYARRLLAAGVAAELHVYPGVFHGAHGSAPDAAIIQRWQRDECEAIRRAITIDVGGSRAG